jgi:putative RNA 2'-phosphotransferase
MDRKRLSKTLAHALRHAPWMYDIELDEQGWAPLPALLNALRQHRRGWAKLTRADIEAVVAAPGKRRYAIEGERIRALYGHSKGVLTIKKRPAKPPSLLYHGTSATAAAIIRVQGLQPMNRQLVHHAVDRQTAQQVGRRKGEHVVILTVHAQAAHDAGVGFYVGNDEIWLSEAVPAAFIGFPSVGEAEETC